MTIARNPYKVERHSLGLLATYSKLDYRLRGTVEEIQCHTDGKSETVRLKTLQVPEPWVTTSGPR